jgi:chromosome segregation ATPase
MSNEEFERRMEFFLNQQARFDANLQRLEESHVHTQQELAKSAEIVTRNEEAVAQLTESVSGLTVSVTELTSLTYEGFSRMLGGFKDTNAKIDALVNAQILTEERLQHLMATADRHISDGHGGA